MTSHHAIVCIAPSLSSSTIPHKYKQPSEDTTHIIRDRLSIQDARTLLYDAQQKPISNSYRVFVIITKKLPLETQNTLLKLFEEPPAYVQFYLVIPQEGMLIPTLASRVQVYKNTQHILTTNDIFTNFFESSYAERLTIIVDITKKKDISRLMLLLEGVEAFVMQDPVGHRAVLQTIIFIRRYISAQGASTKMLLDELALSLPVVK